MTLRTARLELSPPREGDADAIFAACQDERLQRRGWWKSGSEATWAIRDGDTLVGMIGLHRLGDGTGEIGYWMAAPARGRGLLTEAAHAVIDWGFSPDGLALKRIEWRAVVGNTASARAARTLGFRFEGTLRQALANGAGVRDDGWIAGLLPSDDRTAQHWPPLEI